MRHNGQTASGAFRAKRAGRAFIKRYPVGSEPSLPEGLSPKIAAHLDALTARVSAMSSDTEAVAAQIKMLSADVRQLAETTEVLAQILKAGVVNRLMSEIAEAIQEESARYEERPVEDANQAAVNAEAVTTKLRTNVTDKTEFMDFVKRMRGIKNVDGVKIFDDLGRQIHTKFNLLGLWTDADGKWDEHKAKTALTADALRQLVENGADINTTDGRGRTALMAAVITGNEDAVKFLLKSQAGLEIQDNDRWTALMCGAHHGRGPLVQALLGAGADLHTKNSKGETALTIAVKTDHPDSIKVLIHAGADKDAIDSQGWTLLMLAAQEGHASSARGLIGAGAALEAKDPSGRTALLIAVEHSRPDVVKALVAAGADKTIRDQNSQTLLMIAACNPFRNRNGGQEGTGGFLGSIRSIVAAMSDITFYIPTDTGRPRFTTNSALITEILVNAGADCNARNKDGETALLLAVRDNNKEVITALVKAGSDKEARDSSDMTALMIAAQLGRADIVKMLIAAGANKAARSNGNCDALFYARNVTGVSEEQREATIAALEAS